MNQLISVHPIIIFTSINKCTYCDKAKELLGSHGLFYYEYAIDFESQDYADLVSMTGQTTVPNIYIDGQHIGGYSNLVEYYTNQTPIDDFPLSSSF